MSVHQASTQMERTIAFCGNPNVGKSTLFNAYTGLKQHTGNWPGKTVGTAEGHMKVGETSYLLVDLPGTYSLCAHSPEEEVARDYITLYKPDAVVIVCDATCLSRNLNLALQVMQITHRVIVCVNLIDEAERKGIEIDTKKLSELLGVPVVATNARNKKTLNKLRDEIARIADREDCNIICGNGSDEYTINMCAMTGDETDITSIVEEAERIASAVVTYKKESPQAFDRALDRILTGRVTAYPLMILLLLLVLWITIKGANYPSSLLASLFDAMIVQIHRFFDFLRLPEWVSGIVVDGCVSTLCNVVAVMLPPMAIFFPLFTLLEDAGYLPRVAYNLDKPFKRCGACGKQALTMCMGLGCNAAAVVGCRIIDSPRERLIAMLTNNFLPCNGRFPLLITVISLFVFTGGGSAVQALFITLLICLGIAMTFIMSKVLSKTLLQGASSSFTLEMPPYRRPELLKTLTRSLLDRTLFVLGRAVVIALPAGGVIWLLANINIGGVTLLAHTSGFLDPFAQLLGLDGVILLSFILALPANEIVLPLILMSYSAQTTMVGEMSLAGMRTLLEANGWTVVTAVCVVIFTLFHWPCSTTLLTIKKESGSVKWLLAGALVSTVPGIVLCMLIKLLSSFLVA